MKLVYYFPLITSVGIVAADAFRRGVSTDGADFSSKTFDYIVVGGGTAGINLAARLSDNPKTTVGVIEAGEYLPDDPLINTSGNPKYDWMFKPAPQVYANNQAINLPRGNVLGGFSAINVMGFDQGPQVEYDAWAKLGNSGWSWEGLLPNMKGAERFTGVDPSHVNYTNAQPNDIFPSWGKNRFVAADYNSKIGILIGNAVGVFNTATCINRTTGRRSYAATTYYAYNAHRTNFVVLTGAQAAKINFKDTTGSKRMSNLVATGVSFVHKSQIYTVKAKKEVIISAGTFQSPQLLELNGIGNSAILEKNGIGTLVDLPSVGENYQDHMLIATTYELKPGSSNRNHDMLSNNATFATAAATQYATHDGILSSTASTLSFLGMALIANSAAIANVTAEVDRELASKVRTPIQRDSYMIQKGWLKETVGFVELIPYPGYAGVGVPKADSSYITFFTVQHPFSRGSVHIDSSDPLVSPRIDPKYFSKSIVKFVDRLSKTEPLASMIASRQEPGPKVTSDTAIADYIKANVESIYHPISAVSLAPGQLGGVVDADLKVYGTTNV